MEPRQVLRGTLGEGLNAEDRVFLKIFAQLVSPTLHFLHQVEAQPPSQ